ILSVDVPRAASNRDPSTVEQAAQRRFKQACQAFDVAVRIASLLSMDRAALRCLMQSELASQQLWQLLGNGIVACEIEGPLRTVWLRLRDPDQRNAVSICARTINSLAISATAGLDRLARALAWADCACSSDATSACSRLFTYSALLGIQQPP